MKQQLPDLLRRQNGVAATLGKFRNKAFDWKAGFTCVHLARFHLRAMGHKPPKLPPIRSALAARRALDERGWPTVSAMLAAFVEPVQAAAMLPGDLAVIEQDEEHGLGAILVAVAPHKLAGWDARAERLCVLDVDWSEISGAFRV